MSDVCLSASTPNAAKVSLGLKYTAADEVDGVSLTAETAGNSAMLGNTGLLVSKLCFGTMTWGDGRGIFKAVGAVSQAGADELVKTSIDGGINFFDTADN
jgi:hypothetical protein